MNSQIPKLDQAWRKWLRLKRLLQVFIALNVLCIVTGFSLSIHYWGQRGNLQTDHLVLIEKLKLLDEIEATSLQDAPIQERVLHRASIYSEMESLVSRFTTSTRILIWIGALTFLFGIAFPLLVLSLMGKLINQARLELQEAAKNVAREWTQAINQHGDKAFLNVEFWAEALLITGTQLGRYSSHPLAQLGGELSYLVRMEIHKSQVSRSSDS